MAKEGFLVGMAVATAFVFFLLLESQVSVVV